jgi:rod shape-determining protein MreC
MRNLIAFFRRFQVFLLFIFLQFLALSNYFTSFTYPRIQYLSSIGALNAKLWTVQNDITKHFNLSKNNRYLQRENKWLREQLPQSCMQLGRGTVKIDDTLYAQQYSYLPAEVINSTFTRRNNYFTINVGQHQGITVGMGVISSRGIVGVIHAVSEHYSLVKTVLTENINIDVLIEKVMAQDDLYIYFLNALHFAKLAGANDDDRLVIVFHELDKYEKSLDRFDK